MKCQKHEHLRKQKKLNSFYVRRRLRLIIPCSKVCYPLETQPLGDLGATLQRRKEKLRVYSMARHQKA